MTIKLRVTGGAQRVQAEEDCCIQRYGVMMESIYIYMELSGICSPEKPRLTKITILPRFFVAQQEAK
jgi:hypothetical protein